MDRSDVLILGAGFSKAVSCHFPLTDALGHDAIARAGLKNDPRVPNRAFGPAFTFESWLSLLAEDQPHLSEAENLANAALFAKLRESIYSVLTAAEASVFRDPAPSWLNELLTVLHHRRATVLTLNYDTVIEVGVASLDLPGPQGGEGVAPRDILHDMPPLPNVGSRLGGPLHATFRLLKLHGSLDWWAAPRDPSGASLNRTDTLNRFGNPEPIREEVRRQQLPGREPFIVPPAATKSSYYQTPYAREMWRTAAEALQKSDRVSLVGYSLPPADLVMVGMLEAATRKRSVAIDIVNPSPKDLPKRIQGLGVGNVSLFNQADCVEEFVHVYRDRAAADFAQEVAALDPNAYGETALLVAKRSHEIGQTGSKIARIETLEPGVVVMVPAGPAVRMYNATALEYGPNGQPIGDTSPRLKDLIAAVQGARTLVIRRDGVDEVIVGCSWMSTATGLSNSWIAFHSV